jgi:hypothetical protein
LQRHPVRQVIVEEVSADVFQEPLLPRRAVTGALLDEVAGDIEIAACAGDDLDALAGRGCQLLSAYLSGHGSMINGDALS